MLLKPLWNLCDILQIDHYTPTNISLWKLYIGSTLVHIILNWYIKFKWNILLMTTDIGMLGDTLTQV